MYRVGFIAQEQTLPDMNTLLLDDVKDGLQPDGTFYYDGKKMPGYLSKDRRTHTYEDKRGGRTVIHSGGSFDLPKDGSQWVNWFTNYAPIWKRIESHNDVDLLTVTSERIVMHDGNEHYLNAEWAKVICSSGFSRTFIKSMGFDTDFPRQKEPTVYVNKSLRFCGPSDAEYAYFKRESETSVERYPSSIEEVSMVYSSTPYPGEDPNSLISYQGSAVLCVGEYRLTPGDEEDVRSDLDMSFYNLYPDLWGYVVEHNVRVSLA